MSDLTLRPGATDTSLATLAQLLKDLFRATPLGITLAVIQGKR